MPAYAVELLDDALGGLAGERVLILGVAYRGGVKETAFSGAFALRDALAARGATPVAADPLYDDDELRGARLRAVGRRAGRRGASCRPTTPSTGADAGRPARARARSSTAAACSTRRPSPPPGSLRHRRRSGASAASAGDDALAGATVAVERGPLGRQLAVSAASAASASRSTSTFQPVSTVSTHSVSSRSVTHGTPAR